MANYLKLMNYRKNIVVVPVDLDNLSNILSIRIKVISGDEIAIVTYKDGTREIYDSAEYRNLSFHDGEYSIYLDGKIDRIEEFNHRSDPYGMGLI